MTTDKRSLLEDMSKGFLILRPTASLLFFHLWMFSVYSSFIESAMRSACSKYLLMSSTVKPTSTLRERMETRASASSDLGDLEILPRQLSSDNWRQSREILRRLTPSNYSGGDNVGKIHTETAHCITPRLINSLSWVDDHQHRPLLPDDSLIPGHWTGGTFLLLYRPANSRWEWIDTNCLIGFFSQYVPHNVDWVVTF